MQYELYREKMKKVAAFFGRLYAHKVLVTVGLVVLVAILGGLLAVKGTVLYESDCPEEVEYGDRPGYRVLAVLSFARYEYAPAGTSDWSREEPLTPGRYEVRAMTRTALGEKLYTEAQAFTLIPRAITPQVAERSIDYGEEPTAKADLAHGDTMQCTIRFSSRNDRTPEVWVVPESVRITAKNGEDRTHCYRIEETISTLRIKPRKLKVTVSDASKVFDDIKLTYDAYEVSGGKLLDGDSLVALFYASITEAGSIANVPQLHVYNAAGEDVTVFYDLDIRSGTLTVDKRPLILHSASRSFVYDGTAHDHPQYYIDGSTPLVGGHSLRVVGATITDVGKAENALTVAITNRAGRDRTSSYSVFVEAGTLSVTPRSVTVVTPSSSLVYNGEAQSLTQGIRVENEVGDTVRAVDPTTLTNVGSIENRMTVTFHRDGQDVTANYEISYRYGTMSITKRPIYVRILDITREYNGLPLTSTMFDCDPSRGYDLPATDMLTLNTVGEIIRVGSVENRYVKDSVKIRNQRGESMLSNYDVTVENGTLTVVPRAITVTSASNSWVYDGKTKQDHRYEVTAGSLVEGHQVTAEVVTECLNVGIYQNLMETAQTRVWNGKEDLTDQYAITHVYGRLRITGCPITVHTESGEWMYDGASHTIPASDAVWLDPATPLFDGHSIHFVGGTTVLHAGTVPNTYTATVVDRQGQDMTKNYAITYKTGTLTVKKRPITVYTGDGERMYNGRSEVVGAPSMMADSPYDLVKGHSLVTSTWDTDSFVNAGTYENAYNVAVLDRNHLDVTGDYEITYRYGSLVVTQRPVDLTVDVTRVYNGLGFDRLEATPVNGTSLGSGDTAIAYIIGGCSADVGTYDVDVRVMIQNARGRDASDNYIYDCQKGTLTVTPRHISIATEDASKVYDGTPLAARRFHLLDDSLPLGYKHNILLSVTGTATEIGIHPNTADFDSLRILDADHEDVTANYVIDRVIEGTLTIRHDVTVTVVTESATKAYDGLPLRDHTYTTEITRGELPAGFTVDVQVTGSITMPGTTDNTAVVTVRNAHGEDVTALCEVLVRFGTLTVTRKESTDDAWAGQFRPTLAGTYYLRMASYGDFNGRDWLDATPYPNAERVVTLPGFVLQKLGLETQTVSFMQARQWLFPYYVTPSSPNLPITDTVYSERESDPSVRPGRDIYNVNVVSVDNDWTWLSLYMAMPEFARAALLGSHYDDELAYRTFVHEQYLTVDDKTADYLRAFVAEAGLEPTDPELVVKVAALIRKSALYTPNYDPMLDREENVAIAFLDQYREGSDRHFATVATLIYRVLGLPARYVTGYRETVTDPSTWRTIRNTASWVEVYIDGIGWLQLDVTGEEKPPEDDDRPILELEPAFAYKLYDGETLQAPHYLAMTPSLSALLKEGHTYSVEVLGAQTAVGLSESVIMSFTLYDANGRDVTDQYRLQKKTGILRVVDEQAVIVMLSQVQKTYDGIALFYQDADYEILSRPADTEVEVQASIRMTEVGMLTLNDLNRDPHAYLSKYCVMSDGVDVTDQIPLIFVLSGMQDSGTDRDPTADPTERHGDAAEPVLIIKPCAIELTAASAIRMYDGTPLSDPEVTLTGGRLITGHTLIAEAIGTCKTPGTVENVVGNVRIVDGNGQDVTACYTVTCIAGTLTLVDADDY